MFNKKNPGQRGKVAEGKVQKYLNDLSAGVAEFDFSRIYDARSAGGKFPSRPGDFEFYRLMPHGTLDRAVNGLIEAKEVGHDYRLPAKNFKPGQLGKLEKRRMAGGVIVVLVLHTTTAMWRRPDFQWVFNRAGEASWDLREFPQFDTVQAALAGISPLYS